MQLLSLLVLTLCLLVLAPSARASSFASVIELHCGYDETTNTFLPVATVARVGASSSERRVAVQLALFDGATPLGTLGTGLLGSGANGTVPVPIGETRQLRPEAGVAFGDGSAVGGPPLLRNHSYSIRTRLSDFDDLSDIEIIFWECRTGTPPGLDTDSDGFGDAIEDAYTSDRLDPSSRPVVPDGWIADPLGPAPSVDCGLIQVGGPEWGNASNIDTCGLRPGDIILERNLEPLAECLPWRDGCVSREIEFFSNTHFSHALIVIGRIDLNPDNNVDVLDVVVADITLNPSGRSDLALVPFDGVFGDAPPDAVGVYRPATLTRLTRESAARAALQNLWNNGASIPGNRTSFGWNAPAASYTIDPLAFGPTGFYCSSFVANWYFIHYDISHEWWIPDNYWVTPDDLIANLPGMTLLQGFNTDAGVVSFFSPGHIMVVDSQGRRTGIDPNGVQHDEIPGAFWVRTPEAESVSAPGLPQGSKVVVTGFGSGTYALVHQSVLGDASSATAIPGYTRPGQIETFELADLPRLVGRPVAVDDELVTDERVAVTVDVTANDVDRDGDTPVVVANSSPANGTATCAASGLCTYTPNPGFAGSDSFTYTISDGSEETDTAIVRITVRPRLDCSSAVATPALLWPPNHNFRKIRVIGPAGPEGAPASVAITGVTQDEPVDAPGSGDGNTAPDARNVAANMVEVRAERAAGGDGRVYRLAFAADAGNGRTCEGVVTVGVPHDQASAATPRDSAPPSYDSTAAK